MNMLVIIAIVVIGTAVFLGVLIGGEAQKHILRGHEGTRAEKLRKMRRQRALHIVRRRQQLYGPLFRIDSDPVFGSRSEAEDHARWWRRHPGGTRPDLPLPDDPGYDDPASERPPG